MKILSLLFLCTVTHLGAQNLVFYYRVSAAEDMKGERFSQSSDKLLYLDQWLEFYGNNTFSLNFYDYSIKGKWGAFGGKVGLRYKYEDGISGSVFDSSRTEFSIKVGDYQVRLHKISREKMNNGEGMYGIWALHEHHYPDGEVLQFDPLKNVMVPITITENNFSASSCNSYSTKLMLDSNHYYTSRISGVRTEMACFDPFLSLLDSDEFLGKEGFYTNDGDSLILYDKNHKKRSVLLNAIKYYDRNHSANNMGDVLAPPEKILSTFWNDYEQPEVDTHVDYFGDEPIFTEKMEQLYLTIDDVSILSTNIVFESRDPLPSSCSYQIYPDAGSSGTIIAINGLEAFYYYPSTGSFSFKSDEARQLYRLTSYKKIELNGKEYSDAIGIYFKKDPYIQQQFFAPGVGLIEQEYTSGEKLTLR